MIEDLQSHPIPPSTLSGQGHDVSTVENENEKKK
jgi:hypothetical protein